MKKRILAFLLVLLLLTGMLPSVAFAEEGTGSTTEETTVDTTEEATEETTVDTTEEATAEATEEATGETAEEATEEPAEAQSGELIAPQNTDDVVPVADGDVDAVTATVKLTAQKGNTFLCAPYLSLTVSSDLSDTYGFTDSVTDGVSALDALIAAHVRKYGSAFTADTASGYLTVDEAGSVTMMFGTAAPYGTGLALNHEANTGNAASLALSDGHFVTFFCYSSEEKTDAVAKFTGYKGGTHTETAVSAATWGYGCYTYCGTTATNGLQVALVDAATGGITPLDGVISAKSGNYDGKVSIKVQNTGSYLITAYDPDGGVVMPLMQYTGAEAPYIEKLEITASNGSAVTYSPEWDGSVLTGYTINGTLPDSVTSFKVSAGIPGCAFPTASSFTYDGASYTMLYSRAQQGMYTSSDTTWEPYNNVLGIRIANTSGGYILYQLSTAEIKRISTLSNLTVKVGSTTYKLNEDAVSKDRTEYTSMIPADAETVLITPTAYNASYKITINGESATHNAAYSLPVQWDSEGKMVVTIALDPSSLGEQYIASTYTLTLYQKTTETTPIFTTQPVGATYEIGDTAEPLVVQANASGSVQFLWYKLSDPADFDPSQASGGGKSTSVKGRFYTPSTEKAGTYYYYCRVYNKDGSSKYYGYSDIVAITVTDAADPKIQIGNTIPDISAENLAETRGFVYNYGDAGDTLTVECTANVDGQWSNGRWVRVGTSTQVAVEANADGSYTLDTTSLHGEDGGCYYQYLADFTTDAGKTYSDVASEKVYVYIRVTDISQVSVPYFTKQPPESEEYLIGSEVSFYKGAAAGASAGAITYQWYVAYANDYVGAEKLEGFDTAQMKPSTAVSGVFYYFCQATNTLQGYTTTANSNMYVVTVLEKVVETEAELSMSGSGTEEDPYLIETAAHYQEMYDAVANGDFFYGKYFKQVADITLPEDWKPIGTDKYHRFKGTIDCDNHTITIPEGGLPLLGYVQYATIKNLNIYGTKIAGYGLVNNLEGVGFSGIAITIDNVTLKSGSSTLRSGLIGANITENIFAGCSYGYYAVIRNCTIESGVVVGYNKDQTMIGSIAGRMQGSVENCVSYATVYGVNYVGGIIGTRDNAMGTCSVTGCTFGGSVVATGDHVGGIAGGGYENSTAPNGVRINITNNTVTGSVTGADKVGGILGADTYVAQAWNNYSFSGNSFTGTIHCSGQYVGGIIGYYESLNKMDNIAGNTYSAGCGAEKGIGYVKYLDTSYTNPTTMSGTVAFNTANGTVGLPSVAGCAWREDHNRTDDPLGADADKLCKKLGSGETVTPTVYEIVVSGTCKTEYTVGDELDLTGIKITAKWTAGKADTTLSLSDVEVSGYDKNKTGGQTITLTYQKVNATISINVKPKSSKITVTVTILGDSKHGDSGDIHGLARGGLTTWVSTTVEADTANTVWDVLKQVMDSKGYSYSANDKNSYGSVYIASVNGLGEFDNGKNSGWMYTVNGSHPEVGVSARYLKNGDAIVLHYTDDFDYEEGGVYYGKLTGEEAAKAVDELISAIGTVTFTDACAEKINAARKAYNGLTDSEKALVTKLATLESAEAAYSRLAVNNAVSAINRIGTVTTASGPAIENAWNAYDALTTAQKAQVTNYTTLTTATNQWNQLMAQQAIDLIDAVGDVTGDSKDAIEKARTAYDKLTVAQKALVTNYSTLTAAEAEYARLVATDEDREKAQQVMELIDALGTVTVDSEEAVEAARNAYDALTDIQKQLVENYDSLEAAEEKLELLKTLGKVTDPYIITGDYLESLGTPNVGSIGGEWMVIGLMRSGRSVSEDYYSNVVQYVQENIDENGRLHAAKSTDNARIILALTAMGMDVTDVDGHNLLAGLNNMEYIQKQGLNGPIWALIALDSGNYPVPEGDVTRQALVNVILDAQLDDGGWALSGNEADADMTGMALTALAHYYKKDLNVLAAVDRAIECLSRMQGEDGGFSTFSSSGGKVATAESTAQIIVALTALGIDPDTDSRFIKNGNSPIDALLGYFVEDGGFRHVADGERDGMATEQGYYALTAYVRFLEEKTRLYNMTDVLDMGGDPEEIPEETEESTEPETRAPQETQIVDEPRTGGTNWTVIIAIACIALGGGTVAVLVLSRKRR